VNRGENMPKKVDECVKKLKKQGYDTATAFRICNAQYKSKKKKGKSK
jgi:hypothetical protein